MNWPEIRGKVLQRIPNQDISNLTEEEKLSWDKYAGILDRAELSLEDIVIFCQMEKKEIEKKFGDNLSGEYVSKLVSAHNILSKFETFITGDKANREAAIRELTNAWGLQ